MSFIDDMKLGKKLLGGFLVVVVILAIVALYGYSASSSAAASANTIYSQHLTKISYLGDVQADFQQLRAEAYRYTYVPEARSSLDTTIADLQANIKKSMDAFRSKDISDDEKAELASFDTNYAEFVRQYTLMTDAAKANDMKTVNEALSAGSPLINARTATVTAYKNLITINDEEAKAAAEKAAADAGTAALFMAVLTIVGIAISIAVALYLTKSITGPIDQVSRNLKEMGNGHLGNRLKLGRKDEIGEMADVMDNFSNDLQHNVIGTMKKIADGDLTANVRAKDSQDEISPALIQMSSAINAMAGDANMLAKAAMEGKVTVRADATKHQGDYRKIIEGVNNTLDALVEPMREAIRVSGEYAKQDFTARFSEKLVVQGDMIKFKTALNNVGESVSKAIQQVNKQTSDLSAGAEEAAASLNEVTTGANQIAMNAQKVNENAEKSTQGIEQVLKAMEDMSAAVEEVTSSMENVSNQSKQTNESSKEGAVLAQKVEQSMSDISASTETVFEIVKEIEKQMSDITKIVVLIRDLANQTNLLALNAAIEAARAGDAGRGFAVVASEVKSLAEESRSSAEKIEQMITELNNATKNAATATESSKELVTTGAQMSRKALDAFNRIKDAAEKVASAASEVAAAAEEQAATTEEITASIHEVRNQIDGTSKEASNAAAATEEATASINEINKVVDNVNKIVENVSQEMAKFTV